MGSPVDVPDNKSGKTDTPAQTTDSSSRTASGGKDSSVTKATNLASPENSQIAAAAAASPSQLLDRLATVLPGLTVDGGRQTDQQETINKKIEPDGTPANVKKDAQGRVVEVDYPNSTARKFGYDDQGQLNQITQPDGRTLVLQDGKWQYQQQPEPGSHGSGGDNGTAPASPPDGAPRGAETGTNHARGSAAPDISNPVVNSDGTFSYQSSDGSFTDVFADGTQSRVKDASIVASDINGNVTDINYPDGTWRQFGYQDGKLATVTENGTTYQVKPTQLRDANGQDAGTVPELYDANGQPTGIRNPVVQPDGTYQYQDKSGNVIGLHSDLSQDKHQPDGSTLHTDKQGRPTGVDYPGGNRRTFAYDSNGQLNQITDNGQVYHFDQTMNVSGIPIGSWKDQNGNPAPFVSATVGSDGTFNQTLADGRIEHDYTTGSTQKTDGTYSEIASEATQIHDAGSNQQAVDQILGRLSTADREQLMQQYRQSYGTALKDDLQNRFGDQSGKDQQLLADADLRTAGLKTFSDAQAQDMWNRTVDSLEQRATQQGMSPADLAKHEQDYAKYLQDHAGDTVTNVNVHSQQDLVREAQQEIAKDIKPEIIKVSTDHFNIEVDNYGDVTQQQVDQLKQDLETGYKQYQDYYGVDLNTVMGKKYDFKVISTQDLGKEFGQNTFSGGGTYAQDSAISNDVFPGITSNDPAQREGALNVVYHELANGWASLYATKNGQPTNIPAWYGSEGQAGFYKEHALIQQGMTAGAISEYDAAVKGFAQYQADVQAGKTPTGEENSWTSQVIAQSIYQRFGFSPMQQIDQEIQSGQLSFDANASGAENNGRLIYALAEATHTNPLDFFDQNNIPVSNEWRDKIVALGYDASGMTVATSIVPPGQSTGDGQTGQPNPTGPQR